MRASGPPRPRCRARGGSFEMNAPEGNDGGVDTASPPPAAASPHSAEVAGDAGRTARRRRMVGSAERRRKGRHRRNPETEPAFHPSLPP
jgi:hypothetical protein